MEIQRDLMCETGQKDPHWTNVAEKRGVGDNSYSAITLPFDRVYIIILILGIR